MKTTLSLRLTACVFVLSVGLFACRKESSQQQATVSDEEALTISEENADADMEYDDLTEVGLSVSADLEAALAVNSELAGIQVTGGIQLDASLMADLKWKTGPCTVVTVTPKDSTFPKKVTIDFGDGCLCRDGKYRKGLITVELTAPIRTAGASLTISLDGYYVNRVHIEGTKTVTNLSASGTLKYSVTVRSGKVTFPAGRGFSYESSKTLTLIEGADTRIVRDDVYSIEAYSKTTYSNGVTVEKSTESPLIKPVSGKWIVKGVLKLSLNARVVFIDYGDGTNDNIALVTWANGEKEIELP